MNEEFEEINQHLDKAVDILAIFNANWIHLGIIQILFDQQ